MALSIALQYFCFIILSCHVANGSDNSTVTPINRDIYHSSKDLLKQIKKLVQLHPKKFLAETIKAENKGYKAEIMVVTYCKNFEGLNESGNRSMFRILLSFGQHGRELITSELAWKILSILSEEQFLLKGNFKFLNDSLDNILLKVVPMENLNGRKLVENGDLCERRNGRGVDLNRNWRIDWGKKEKDYDPHEENPGSAPFSEPETQIMRKLALSFSPHLWINVHSGMEALFMPYDHRNTTPSGSALERMKWLLSHLNEAHCHRRCVVGCGGASVGYLAHGTATDYMYDIVGVPLAFTFEVYGDLTASPSDCFKMFNPIDLHGFNKVLDDWSAAFLNMFQLAPYGLKMVASRSNETTTNSSSSSSSSSYSSWEKWESIDTYLEEHLVRRRHKNGVKVEMFDVGMEEMRTYFRLLIVSSVVLVVYFYSTISRASRNPVCVSLS